jgi:hypothetical protein
LEFFCFSKKIRKKFAHDLEKLAKLETIKLNPKWQVEVIANSNYHNGIQQVNLNNHNIIQQVVNLDL